MKVFRVHSKLPNGCFSPGFYHTDKDFLLQAVNLQIKEFEEANPGEKLELEVFIEEADLNITNLSLGDQNGSEPTQSSQAGSQDQQTPGSETTDTGSGSTH